MKMFSWPLKCLSIASAIFFGVVASVMFASRPPILGVLDLCSLVWYSSLTWCASESIRCKDSELEQVPRIEQPREARLRAMALPIPRDAPVMIATLSWRSCSRRRIPVLVELDVIAVGCGEISEAKREELNRLYLVEVTLA